MGGFGADLHKVGHVHVANCDPTDGADVVLFQRFLAGADRLNALFEFIAGLRS